MAESLLLYLLQSSIAMAVSGSVILLIRKAFHKNLTAKTRYHLWFLLLILAAAPFVMKAFPWLNRLSGILNALFAAPVKDSWNTGGPDASGTILTAPSLLNDFSVSVERNVSGILALSVIGIWICGAALFTAFTVISGVRVNRLKSTALPVRDEMLEKIFSECRRQLGIRRDIPLRFVSRLSSPVTAGIITPCVLLPSSRLSGLSDSEIRCILLHELQHYKHRDILWGLFFRILLILYWFHPMVWLALKEMESDREIACDTAVLSVLGDNGSLDYGTALLHFTASLSHLTFGQTAGIGGSKKEIRKRIIQIAAYRQDSEKKCFKSRMLFLLAAALVISATPSASALDFSSDRYHGILPHTAQEDLSSFFGDFEGSFVLYDIPKDQYLVYGEDDARTRVSPNSTYKIYSALMALDAGIISPENSQMSWDKKVWPYDTWNRDQTLNPAMQNSVNWYFQNLDRSQGIDSVKQYLTGLSYGNLDVSGGLSRFWLESSLKISPLEQVKLLSGLCQNTLAFTADDMATVTDALYLSSDGTASLYGKTGTGTIDGKNTNGWFLGFVEAEEGTTVFAVHIHGDDDATGARAGEIALRILKEKNLYSKN